MSRWLSAPGRRKVASAAGNDAQAGRRDQVADLIAVPLLGSLSDRIGRKPVLIGDSVFIGLFAYPFFLMVQSGSVALSVTCLMLLVETRGRDLSAESVADSLERRTPVGKVVIP